MKLFCYSDEDGNIGYFDPNDVMVVRKCNGTIRDSGFDHRHLINVVFKNGYSIYATGADLCESIEMFVEEIEDFVK